MAAAPLQQLKNAGKVDMTTQRLAEGDIVSRTTRWSRELSNAKQCASNAGEVIRSDFGRRDIIAYKGLHDVLLGTDVRAQETIVHGLTHAYPGHGIVAEEGLQEDWSECEYTWVVDPLDGTNNFGYGIAHCAVAISLFRGDRPLLAVVFDPIVDRWFVAAEDLPLASRPPHAVSLQQATISLVTGYSAPARQRGCAAEDVLYRRCKRVCSLWAPALDLALVATGSLDGMVCIGANFLDVCAGMFLVRAAGGVVLDARGTPMGVRRSQHVRPVTFVAAHSDTLARQLLDQVCPLLTDR